MEMIQKKDAPEKRKEKGSDDESFYYTGTKKTEWNQYYDKNP